jgi:hypothetical protein
MSSSSCKGPCLPHCYSKNKNYLLFIITGIFLGIILYHIKVVQFLKKTLESLERDCTVSKENSRVSEGDCTISKENSRVSEGDCTVSKENSRVSEGDCTARPL